jgi:hypothetical protein
MDEKSDREAAAAAGTGQRMAAFPSDPVTIEHLQKLVQQLEEQLRKSEQARAANYLTLALVSLGTNLVFQGISSDRLAPLQVGKPDRKQDIRMS